ncbi:unnamed protein product [Prorocentrum cordatum]|uniref:Uncharacterized protein n=1 Tax=Prorocentrum cordatum TaxID=2364126 RepID=A0ABN9TY63_9DINO|nr:unnamed protein product [Polarella glacialis]
MPGWATALCNDLTRPLQRTAEPLAPETPIYRNRQHLHRRRPLYGMGAPPTQIPAAASQKHGPRDAPPRPRPARGGEERRGRRAEGRRLAGEQPAGRMGGRGGGGEGEGGCMREDGARSGASQKKRQGPAHLLSSSLDLPSAAERKTELH